MSHMWADSGKIKGCPFEHLSAQRVFSYF